MSDIDPDFPTADDPIYQLFDNVEFTEVDPMPDTPIVEDEEKPFAGATTQVGDGTCRVCGSPTFRPPGLTKAGAKRRIPRYCDLHAPNAKVPSSGPEFKGVESQLQRVQEELADDIRLLATLAGPLLPVTGMYLLDQADPFTIAIIKLAKNNTKILKVLHRAAQVAPIYTVAQTMAGTAYAVQVDMKGASADNVVARRLGVKQAYDAVYQTEPSNGSAPPHFQSAPRYSTVQ